MISKHKNNVIANEIRICITILEQPASKIRFRYQCEGTAGGRINGKNTTDTCPSFPRIGIVGPLGNEKVLIVVSCVTKDAPYKTHPHNLIGAQGRCIDGVCKFYLNSHNPVAELRDLRIQCVKKEDVATSLNTRREKRIDPFREGFDHARNVRSIDLSCVRLCFQGFIQMENGTVVELAPVISDPFCDKKTNPDLKIWKMSHSRSPADGSGTTEIMLFCEKVASDNIEVHFFENCSNWSAKIKPSSVHRQYGIAFWPPAYGNPNIKEPIDAFIRLYRPKDGEYSEPCKFTFTPKLSDHIQLLFEALGGNYSSDVLLELVQQLNNSSQKENEVHKYLPESFELDYQSGELLQLVEHLKNSSRVEKQTGRNNTSSSFLVPEPPPNVPSTSGIPPLPRNQNIISTGPGASQIHQNSNANQANTYQQNGINQYEHEGGSHVDLAMYLTGTEIDINNSAMSCEIIHLNDYLKDMSISTEDDKLQKNCP